MADPVATVYIPTLNGGDRLRACLSSLETQTLRTAVVVADNAPAGDGCRDLIEREFPWVTRIPSGRNLGFGPALNRAIAAAGEGSVILLNDDAVAEPEFVAAMVAESGESEMVAAVMVDAGDRNRIDSAGVVVDQTLMGFDYLTGEPVSALGHAEAPLGPTGGGALYRRETFERVGGFDENIFLYYEDVDLALRIRSEGGRCRIAPGARAAHGYSETLGARTGGKYSMTGWSRGYLLRRYGITSRPATLAGALLREAVICAGQIVKDRTAAGTLARIKGWRDAAGLPRREVPPGAAIRMSALRALELRRRRHGG